MVNHPNRSQAQGELREQMRKAESVMGAARQLAYEYRENGARDLGNLIENSLGALPVTSLARLHDMIKSL